MRLVSTAVTLTRAGARVPVFFLEQGLSGAAAGLRLAGRLTGIARSAPVEAPEQRWTVTEVDEVDEVGAVDEVDVEPEPVERRPEPVSYEPEPPEPIHVSEETVLVAETAEEGAEEGAGPELHVDEPWAGYDSMTAAEIRARLRTADAAEAAAVRLYETAGKGRSTVLEASAAAVDLTSS